MRSCVLVGLCLLLGGCRHPLQFVTESSIDGTLQTESRVAFDTPPLQEASAIRPFAVEGPLDPCRPRVALVDVDGLLLNSHFTGLLSQGENPVALFREKLRAVAVDPLVRAVVIRINSPGGSVTASDTMRQELVRFRQQTGLPVVVSVQDVGTGGAYYLATAADVIQTHPTSLVGGIGVLINFYNLRDLLQQFNIIPEEVKSGDLIDMGSSARMLTDQEKKLFQAMADEYHERFKTAVRQARKLEEPEEELFDGRIVTASQAQTAGLIDRIGYLEDALHFAAELGKAPGSQVVFYRRDTDVPRSIYSITPNVPLLSAGVFPSIPGFDRAKLPGFLYLWQPELSLEKLAGK